MLQYMCFFCGVKFTVYIKLQGGFILQLIEKLENNRDI